MPTEPSAEEYEQVRTSWKQFKDRQQMAADVSDETDPTEPDGTVDEADDDGGDDATDETEAEGGDTPPQPADGDAEVELVINERSADHYHQQEEEFQEQLPPREEGQQVEAVEGGLRVHYKEEDHEAVQAAKAILNDAEPGTMYDHWEDGDPPDSRVSDRDEYDRVWLKDISANEPFGPFSPTSYSVSDMIDALSGRIENDVQIVSDVYEVE